MINCIAFVLAAVLPLSVTSNRASGDTPIVTNVAAYVESATNGLVRADVTNGLASVAYVDAATNGLSRVEVDPTVGLTNGTIYVKGETVTPIIAHQSLEPVTNYVDAATNAIAAATEVRIDDALTNYYSRSELKLKEVTDGLPGGVTWVQSAKANDSWGGITYGNGRFVAGNVNNAGLWYSDDGINWTQSDKKDGVWPGLAYGNGRYVAGSESGGGLWYSDDGVTWTQSDKKDGYWYGIAYGGGRYVAGSESGDGLWYSDDGVTWAKSGKTDDSWGSIAYGNGRYVAGSSSAGIWYSDDGVTWTQSAKTDDSWGSIAYGNGRYVAGSSSAGIWYSDDGVTWTQSDKNDGIWLVLAYGGGRYVAGSYNNGLWYSDHRWSKSIPVVQRIKVNGEIVPADSNNVVSIEVGSGVDTNTVKEIVQPMIAGATNGLLRTESDPTVGLTNGTIYIKGESITPLTEHQSLSPISNYVDRVAEATLETSTNYTDAASAATLSAANSYTDAATNAITATLPRDYPAVSNAAMTAYHDKVPVAALTNANGVALVDLMDVAKPIPGTGGTTWTETAGTDGGWRAIAYGNDRYVAGSYNAGLWYSDDGIHWTQSKAGDGWWALAYGNCRYVAGNYNGKGLWYSDDGINWTQSEKKDGDWRSAAFGNGRFVANNISGVTFYSDDGIHWTQTMTGLNFYGIAYGNGRFVAGTYYSGLWYSDDGINWAVTAKANLGWRSVAYGNGRFIAANGGGSGLWYSDDGTNWVQSAKANENWWATAFGNGRFVAGGDGIGLWYSVDGKNWVQSSKTDSKWYALASGYGRFVAGNNDGSIWYSGYDTTPPTVPVVQRIKVNGEIVEADERNAVNIVAGTDEQRVREIAEDVATDATNGLASVEYVDNRMVSKSGDTMSGDLSVTGKVFTTTGYEFASSGVKMSFMDGTDERTVLSIDEDYHNVSMGYRSEASGNGAFAVGRGASAKELGTVAVGNDVRAKNGSVAVGNGAFANFSYAVSVGRDVIAQEGATAVGTGGVCGEKSVAVGAYANGGSESVSVGHTAKASGDKSVAVGENATAAFAQSVAIGSGCTAHGTNTVNFSATDNPKMVYFKEKTLDTMISNSVEEVIGRVARAGTVGEIIWYGGTSAPKNFLICNGASVSRTTYSNLFAVVGTKFGYASSTTFYLPSMNARFVEGTTTGSSVGTKYSAGLPNIKGSITPNYVSHVAGTDSGALYRIGPNTATFGTTPDSAGHWFSSIGLDASKSSSIYGNSTTVQPASIMLLPCIRYEQDDTIAGISKEDMTDTARSVLTSAIDTSIPSSASNTKVPSTALLKTQLATKQNTLSTSTSPFSATWSGASGASGKATVVGNSIVFSGVVTLSAAAGASEKSIASNFKIMGYTLNAFGFTGTANTDTSAVGFYCNGSTLYIHPTVSLASSAQIRFCGVAPLP